MATSPSDKLVQDQEVGTEEVDPVKTTEKEDKARTEEDEVRTEEQEVQTEEEAIESLLASTRNLTIQDAESDQGTENHNPQEQSMVHPKLYDRSRTFK